MWMHNQYSEKILCPVGRKLSPRVRLISLLLIVASVCFETSEEKSAENFQEVKKIAAQVAPDLKIYYYGAEIYFTNDVLKKLEENIHSQSGRDAFCHRTWHGNALYEIHTAFDRLLHLGITSSSPHRAP